MSNYQMSKLLLHSCCAPCLTHPLTKLRKKFAIVVYFYNPNINPRAEYTMRLLETQKYCAKQKCELLKEKYDPENWYSQIRGLEQAPERGQRCQICYRMRLAQTAKIAQKQGFPYFATTLSISPHKNATLLNKIGQALASKYKLKFLEADWKKQDGFRKSVELSTAAGLRRQNYCGCEYSKK